MATKITTIGSVGEKEVDKLPIGGVEFDVSGDPAEKLKLQDRELELKEVAEARKIVWAKHNELLETENLFKQMVSCNPSAAQIKANTWRVCVDCVKFLADCRDGFKEDNQELLRRAKLELADSRYLSPIDDASEGQLSDIQVSIGHPVNIF